jgi:hypothetical protein
MRPGSELMNPPESAPCCGICSPKIAMIDLIITCRDYNRWIFIKFYTIYLQKKLPIRNYNLIVCSVFKTGPTYITIILITIIESSRPMSWKKSIRPQNRIMSAIWLHWTYHILFNCNILQNQKLLHNRNAATI